MTWATSRENLLQMICGSAVFCRSAAGEAATAEQGRNPDKREPQPIEDADRKELGIAKLELNKGPFQVFGSQRLGTKFNSPPSVLKGNNMLPPRLPSRHRWGVLMLRVMQRCQAHGSTRETAALCSAHSTHFH